MGKNSLIGWENVLFELGSGRVNQERSTLIVLRALTMSWRVACLQQSTYQAVLVTDGSRAYAIYSYEQGGMRWSRTWLERSCVVGYGTKTKRNHYQAPGSFSSEIFSIDSQSFVDKRGTSRRGMICLSLSDDNVEPEPPTPEQECLRWINNEPDPEWAEELPGECPARRREATRRGGYRRVSRTRRVDCYEPRFPTRSGASLQCCYNRRNGACLSKQPASGRAYRAHYKSPAKRQEADEWPYEKCCVDSSTYCSLFYDKRPASRCATRAPPPQPRPCRGFLCGIIIVVFRPRRPRFRRPRPSTYGVWNLLDGLSQNDFINQSIGDPINQSINQSLNQPKVNQSDNTSVNQSIGHSIIQLVTQSVSQLITQSTNSQSITDINQSINQSINWSLNQAISPINQSDNKSVTQATNQQLTRRGSKWCRF